MKKKSATIGIIATIIALIIIISYLFTLNHDYYKIKSRVEKIKEALPIDENYKTVGWLRVQGTNIDFPVVKEKYTQSFSYPIDKEEYVWLMNEKEEYKDNIIISGHNIFNLSKNPKISDNSFKRMESLLAFVYYDFAKKNQYIQYTLKQKDYIYKIYAVAFIKNEDMNSLFRESDNDYTSKVIKDQINLYKEKSLYDYDIEVDEKDKLITLVTCTRFFKEQENVNFIVSGRLLRENEKNKKYEIEKNKKNYLKLEEEMSDNNVK